MDYVKTQKKARSISIRTKLIAVIIPIVFVIILSFFALSRNMIIKISKEKLMAQSEVYARDIYAWTDRIFGELQVYKDTIEEGGFRNDAEVLAYMETSVDKNDAYPVGLYMGDDKGVYLDASGWVPGDDWILTEREWYLDGKDNAVLAFGEPYYDSQTGDMCVSATVRMSKPDAVRVLAVDVYLDYVCELVAGIDENESGSSFLVTKGSRTVIAHPDVDMMAVTLDTDGLDSLYTNAGVRIADGQTGFLSLEGNDGTYFVCINEIPGTDWLLVSYMSRKDVLAGLRRLEFVMVVIAVAAALVLLLVTMRLMSRVVKPVARVTDVIQKVADGDFSQNIEARGNDEIARMSAHMQTFLVQMRGTISEIAKIAEWLDRQSEENDRISTSLTDSSRNQTEAMRLLSSKTGELSKAAGQVAEQMGQLADVIREADEQGKYADEMMRQTVEISANGKEAAERVSSGMQHIEESISSLSQQIMQTDEAIEQIGSMVEMIVNVAEETSLLSLNASIEAAHAGESGKGFAVVAGQIAKLAVSSGEAADDISRLTAEIKGAMHQAIVKMEESVAGVKASAELVGENRMTFETVFEKVGETDKTVEHMVKLVGRAETVASNMQRIAENQVTEAAQITESAGELDRYTRTVNDDSGVVAQNAKEFERESKNLMEHVRKFRI